MSMSSIIIGYSSPSIIIIEEDIDECMPRPIPIPIPRPPDK